MKFERTVLSVLGVVFLVELAIGIPALRGNHNDEVPQLAALPTATAALPSSTAMRPTAMQPTAAQSTAVQRSMTAQPIRPSDPPKGRVSQALAMGRPPQPADPPQPTSEPATAAPTAVPSATLLRPRRALASVLRPRQIALIDDVPLAGALPSFTYSGHWEHVRAIDDGRTGGTSTRSYREGARAMLRFTGTEVRVFGVCGQHGGRALVAIDGHSAGTIDFYATAKEPHMLVFTSPHLAEGTHLLSISVATEPDATKKRYVNIDGAEVRS